MRKTIAAIGLLLVCVSSGAQHWAGVSADAAYAWHSARNGAVVRTGWNGAVGATYQFEYGHFTLETGLRGVYTQHAVGFPDSVSQETKIDGKGQTYQLNSYVRDRRETDNSLTLSIPLLFGAEYSYFYFLGGAKVGLNLYTHALQTAQIATSGEYDLYYDPLENMPNHGFHDYEVVQMPGTLPSALVDVRLAAEIGTVIYTFRRSPKYRVGVFAEYGFLHAHDVLCGIRFTAFFKVKDVPKPPDSYPCRCRLY